MSGYQYCTSPEGGTVIWDDLEECREVNDTDVVYRRTVSYGDWEPVPKPEPVIIEWGVSRIGEFGRSVKGPYESKREAEVVESVLPLDTQPYVVSRTVSEWGRF